MSSSDYVTRYRLYKLGGFAHNFEKVLMGIGKGNIELSKLTSMSYFMSYSKRKYEEMNLLEEAQNISKMIDQWEYWIQLSHEIERRRTDHNFYPFLLYLENKITTSFKNIILDNDDNKLKSIVISNTSLYEEYVKHLLAMKQKEILYEILSDTWLNIYTNKGIKMDEIRYIVEKMRTPEEQLPPEMRDESVQVVETIDNDKANIKTEELESTPLGFRKVLTTIMPLLDIFRENFYKDTEMKTKLNNAEIFTFSILMTANKIMKNNKNVQDLVKKAYLTCKRIHNYNLIKTISKSRGVNTFIINDFETRYERLLSTMVLNLFEDGQNLITEIEKLTVGKKDKAGNEEEQKKVLNYVYTKSQVDHKHFVGWQISHDDITTITEMLKSGEKMINVDTIVEPFSIKFSDFPSITIIIGMTSSGKTVFSINLIQVALNESYTVFDCSTNYERGTEMCFCSLPLEEKYYKTAYKALIKQQMVPKKFPMYILFPFYGKEMLPKKIPACGKIVTIPLYKLANKEHAMALLFSSYPNPEVSKLVNFILVSLADETWDLNRLRYELTKLVADKKKQPEIWVPEKIGTKTFSRCHKFDAKTVKQALSLLLPRSDIISSGKTKTAINFDELCKPGVFVTVYLNCIPSKTDCKSFMTWFFNALIDYAVTNKGKKIGILLNELQTTIPSQSLIGGVFASKDYGTATEYASSALNWRGYNLKVIGNTQMQSQTRPQLRTQAGQKIIFHTVDEDDLKYGFDLIQSQQLRENMKMVVVNKFFKDYHLCCFVQGPENENIKVVASGVPTCGFELPNTDFLELYEKIFPTDMIETQTFIRQIDEDREKSFFNAIKDDDTVKLLDSGTEIVTLAEDEIKTDKATIEALIEQASKTNDIPETHEVISKTELGQMQKIEKDEEIIKKQELEKIESSHLVDTNKQAVIDVGEYMELQALKHDKNYAKVEEVCKEFREESETVQKVYYTLLHIFLSCEPFKFVIGRSERTKTKPPYLLLGEDILKPLGFNFKNVNFYLIWERITEKSIFFKNLLRHEKIGRYPINIIDKEQLENFTNSLNQDLKTKVLLMTSKEYYPLIGDKLPWKQEIKELQFQQRGDLTK